MDALVLLLLDSRAPAGGHAHSGGMEPAVDSGLVRDIDDVEAFCRGRLRTAGRVAAAFAVAAHDLAAHPPRLGPAAGRHADADPATGPSLGAQPGVGWGVLDAEYEARLPSEALRAASRQLGNGLRRLLRSMFPEVELPWPDAPPHHPIALGAGVCLAGGDADLAAESAALACISAPASAAVRLLGLDPIAVHGMLARLATDRGAFAAPAAGNTPRSLPADSAPLLDLLADVHRCSEVRLFAS